MCRKFLFLWFFLYGCLPGVTLEQQMERAKKLEELLTAGTLALREGDAESIAEAEAIFGLAREISGEDPRVLDGLGSVRWYQGKKDLAQRYFAAAIKVDPSYDRAYGHLALLAEEAGQLETARQLYVQALEINPLNYRARNNLAVLLMDGSSTNVSQHLLRKARAANFKEDGEGERYGREKIERNMERTRVGSKEVAE